MRTRTKLVSVILIAAAMTALTVTAMVMTAPSTEAFVCECADLDAPVICQGGKVYPNPCVARCFKAKNCRPY